MVHKEALQQGAALLARPVLPLVQMVEFFLLTGDFTDVNEVIDQMPADITTDWATYTDPAVALRPYADLLQPLLAVKNGEPPAQLALEVVNGHGGVLDPWTAATVLVAQQVLTRELEKINSLLCAPCGCTLCCVGPTTGMYQSFFEIPLAEDEVDRFALTCVDTKDSRTLASNDEPSLVVDGRSFDERPDPLLIHWKSGWSLILPRASRCPHLDASGRCLTYTTRPSVCRRPQIFAYMVEKVTSPPPQYRVRQSLLAVVDCPYVQELREEISAYAAACELNMIFRENKA